MIDLDQTLIALFLHLGTLTLPRVCQRRRGFTYDSVPNFSGNLDFVPCLFTLAIMAAGHQFDLPYSVELWDEGDTRVEELIALTADYNVARAAYEEAMKRGRDASSP